MDAWCNDSTTSSVAVPRWGSLWPSRTSSPTTADPTWPPLISYYGFVSLFPLLLLLTSVLGFVLEDDPALQERVLESALANFPLLSPQLTQSVGGFQGSGVALAIGIVGTLYGALRVMQAAQAALNRSYAVPRFAQPNPLTSRLRSLLPLAAAPDPRCLLLQRLPGPAE